MGNGHALELIQYFVPPSADGQLARNDLGASHLAFYVEGIEELYTDLGQKGMRFINPPASRRRAGVLSARPSTPRTLTATGWSSSKWCNDPADRQLRQLYL